jgi:DNA polymerase III epsilon subunit-like protein
MKYAVIDTETNGLPDYKLPADDPKQPRLASLAIVMLDDEFTTKIEDTQNAVPTAELELMGQKLAPFRVVAEHEFLVKPDGWKMTPGAAEVNGLTDELLEAKGIDISEVLGKYRTLIESGYAIAAYGAQHDCKIMRGEFRRHGLPDHFEQTKNVCLMRALMPFKVTKANGKGGWPKLEDACRFFGIPVEPEPHSALAGARCAAAVLLAINKRSGLPAPEVHYAKNPPTPAPTLAKTEPEPTAPAPKRGDRKNENGVELEHNGRQWLPVVNKENYPKRFDAQGARI